MCRSVRARAAPRASLAASHHPFWLAHITGSESSVVKKKQRKNPNGKWDRFWTCPTRKHGRTTPV